MEGKKTQMEGREILGPGLVSVRVRTRRGQTGKRDNGLERCGGVANEDTSKRTSKRTSKLQSYSDKSIHDRPIFTSR
jgi:hypothetical protein